jgi:hypothetical protein
MKINRNFYLALIFIAAFFSKVKAQSSWGNSTHLNANIGIVAGYSGFGPHMLEAGIGFQPWDVRAEYVGYPFDGFLALYEFSPTRNLYGTSLNFWYLSGPVSCGLGVNRYSDYTNETYGIKPMIGVSIFRIGIMYGFNFFLNKNEITNFSHSSLTIKYYLPIWERKDQPYDLSY